MKGAPTESMGEANRERKVKGERFQLLKYWVELRLVLLGQRGAFPGKARTAGWPTGIFHLC